MDDDLYIMMVESSVMKYKVKEVVKSYLTKQEVLFWYDVLQLFMKETPDTYGDHFLSEHPIHENSRNVYSFLRTIKNIEIKHGIKPYEYDNEPSYPDDDDECNIDQEILSRLDGIYEKLVVEFIDDGYDISYEPYYFRTVESIRIFKQVDISQLSIDENK